MSFLPIFLLSLPAVALAQSTETEHATERVGWVSPKATRSTWGIIWSCMSIFLVCSWKCVHLNCPTLEEMRGGWHHFKLGSWKVPYFPKPGLRSKWRRRLGWMLAISVAPEVGVVMAFKQYRRAKRCLSEASELFSGRENPLTMAHAFALDMGAVWVRDATRREPIPLVSESMSGGRDQLMSTKFPDPAVWVTGVSRPATLDDLYDPNVFPDLSENEIMDRSKSDAFTKLFALAQSVWLITQSIARAVNGLAITELELVTVSFVTCAAVMYALWWNKPFDAETRHILLKLPDNRSQNGTLTPIRSLQLQPGPSLERDDEAVRTEELSFDELTDFVFFAGDHDELLTVVLYLTGTIFSAIHLAAWNFDFPSVLIQNLWRYSAVGGLAMSLYPVILVSIGSAFSCIPSRLKDFLVIFFGTLMMVLMFLYLVCRVIIWVLTFYCFSSMPASAYEPLDWTGFLPHFG
ncbi:hypothetical protein QBC47DRAFT_392014 [Echria macrotheca]|uniref:Transmembrane protein n=1 Tax=Echria macrotheca TaxID=438768 RepID=A0AAJ0B5C5_9PEZI|nr:hypothetical protein QBC47DRAFT_392014 [Echria macrotheca]